MKNRNDLFVLRKIQRYCEKKQKNKCEGCRYRDEEGCKLSGKNPLDWYLVYE